MKLPEDFNFEAALWNIQYSSPGGHVVDRIYPFEEYEKLIDGVPERWRGLQNRSVSEVIDILWEGCEAYCPAYIRHLKSSLLTIFWGEGSQGTVLIYCLKDWEEAHEQINEIYISLEQAIIGGVPALEEDIALLESKNGGLPESLKALWRSHCFFFPKNCSHIAGPDRERFDAALIPEKLAINKIFKRSLLAFTGKVCEESKEYECLAFANVWQDFPYCFIREQGESDWEDYIVWEDKITEVYESVVFWSLDDFLLAEI